MKKALLVLFCWGLLLFPGCSKKADAPGRTLVTVPPREAGGGEGEGDESLIQVIVTTDLIRELMYSFAGSFTRGRVIVEKGQLPGAYIPTEKDKADIGGADLVIYMGLGLESPELMAVIDEVKAEGKVKVYALADGLEEGDLIKDPAFPGGIDPHYWWSPKAWEKILLFTAKLLSREVPEGSFSYRSVYHRYGEATSMLRRYFDSWLLRISEEDRFLVTPCPAFGYLAREYGYKTFSLYPPGSLSLSASRMNEAADFVIKNKVKVIYPDSFLEGDSLVTGLQELLKTRNYTVKIGEPLFSYALGEPGSRYYTYIGAGRELVDRIYSGLKKPGDQELPSRPR